MNRRMALAQIGALTLGAWSVAAAAKAKDRLPEGAYVLTYNDQAVLIELAASGETRAFTLELEEVAAPLTVIFTFDGKGGMTGIGTFSGGVWKWSGTSDGVRASGKTTFTYGGASATVPFELIPRSQYKMGLNPGQGGRKAKAPRGRKA